MRKTFKTCCGACHATGVYVGFAEPNGTAVVCLECGGSGMKEVELETNDGNFPPHEWRKPFTGREMKANVQKVYRSRGRFCLSCGPKDNQYVTYEEFLTGKMPPG